MDEVGPQRCPAGMDALEPFDVFTGLATTSVFVGFSFCLHSFVVCQFYADFQGKVTNKGATVETVSSVSYQTVRASCPEPSASPYMSM